MGYLFFILTIVINELYNSITLIARTQLLRTSELDKIKGEDNMKNEEVIDVSFAGEATPVLVLNEVENTTPLETTTKETQEIEGEKITEEDNEPIQVVVSHAQAFTDAIEIFFNGYQVFQEGMQSLTKKPNPKLLMGQLTSVLEGFQLEIKRFEEAEFDVPEIYLEGHAFILEAIKQYEVFLVEYPAVLSGKGGLKAMKKVAKLGKLNASADQNMKKAFRSFDEASQGE